MAVVWFAATLSVIAHLRCTQFRNAYRQRVKNSTKNKNLRFLLRPAHGLVEPRSDRTRHVRNRCSCRCDDVVFIFPHWQFPFLFLRLGLFLAPNNNTVHGRDSVCSSRAARRTRVNDVQSMNCVAVATDCEDVCSA